MKRLFLAALLALTSTLAFAQSLPTPNVAGLKVGGTAQTFPTSGNLVGTTDTQTLSGKAIDGGSNTLSNVANASLASMGANSLKANTTASSATPTDFGTSTGTAQYVFNSYAVNSPGLDIASGSSGTPITTQGPTVRFSRVENVSPGVSVCNNNAADNECNATMALYSTGTAADGMQNTALYAGAQSTSTANASAGAVGANLIGLETGAGTGIGTGAYVEGRRNTDTGKALGAEVRVTNETSTNGAYSSSGFPTVSGVWATAGGTATAGLGYGLGSAGQTFNVGFAATSGSVTSDTFEDDSNAATSLKINGTHSTAQISGTGFTVGPSGQVSLKLSGTELAFDGPTSGSVSVYPNSTSTNLSISAPIILGANGGTAGSLQMAGATSGYTTLKSSTTGGHLSFSGSGSPPTASSCAGFSLASGSTDTAGRATFTSATTCAISFGTTFASVPFCNIAPETAASTVRVQPTTSTLTATFGTAQTSMAWECFGL